MKKTIATAVIIGLFSPMIANAADITSVSDVHTRSLAASCAACHGTQGNAVSANNGADSTPALAGVQKAEIISKLTAFKSGERPATVMQRHAKGLTSDEITALAEYFSGQVPKASATLKSQKLQADHAN